MHLLSEPSYATTNWYQKSVAALKNQARKKRVQLCFSEDAEEARGEACAFVLGASVAWLGKTVSALQAMDCHPILLNELPEYPFAGRYSCVKTDYRRFMALLSAYFAGEGKSRTAFYGMNPASFSDISRRSAFAEYFPSGEIFQNNGSLRRCFSDFYAVHAVRPFDSVICANDFAAVSLSYHLKQTGEVSAPCVAVQSNAQILTCLPDVLSVSVDHASLAAAAFEIADCILANDAFVGMRVTVDLHADFLPEGQSLPYAPTQPPHAPVPDTLYADGELSELMRIEKLLSSCDETDLQILRLLSLPEEEIGASTFLSDNGVKYRIKKMKRLCGAASKRDIPPLLAKYGIEI